jgi:radical SAM protein with 4Fe4S-binding SPASM domain
LDAQFLYSLQFGLSRQRKSDQVRLLLLKDGYVPSFLFHCLKQVWVYSMESNTFWRDNMHQHPHGDKHPGGDLISRLHNESSEQNNALKPPFLVSYSITQECNLKCKHCYSESAEGVAKDELDTQQSKNLIDDIASMGSKLLIMDGGEPLKRPDFFELVRHATSRGLRTVVGTNATLIDIDVAKKMIDAGVMAVQISVDGVSAQTHDWFRGVQGSFEKALAGARACKEAGLPFQFGMTIRRGTVSELPNLLKLAVDMGANAAELFDLVEVPRVKREIPNEVLTKDERRKVMNWLAKTQTDYPLVIRTPGCTMYPLLLQSQNITPKHFPKEMLSRIPYFGRGCAAGMPNGYITILPNGDVIPCMLLQTVLGNVKKDRLSDIWSNSEILKSLRDRNNLRGECGKCEHKVTCSGCRGRAYEVTGDYLATDPGCFLI